MRKKQYYKPTAVIYEVKTTLLTGSEKMYLDKTNIVDDDDEVY